MRFPDSKGFAFSILDDTDDSTVENVKPVYDKLREYGFRTTKSVWPLGCPEGSRLFFAAETLQNRHYLQFVHDLVDDGFEIAFHGATMESSRRERTLRGLEFLREEFGSYPRLFCNHGHNRENLYWGHKRLQTRLLSTVFRLMRNGGRDYYCGDIEGSEYFWGDLCKRSITYVRNFTFNQVDVRQFDPETPYRLPTTQYVNYWFSTSDAPDVKAFTRLLTRERIDDLVRSGGVCLVSTHLGKGFSRHGKLDCDVEHILQYLSESNGWFAPVTTILDHLVEERNGGGELTWLRRVMLESRFLADRIVGTWL